MYGYAVNLDSEIIKIEWPETTIGRNRTNHVVLKKKSLKISRYHAVIKFFDDIPFIKDVSDAALSEWGVSVNGMLLLKNRWVEIQFGDKVQFGAPAMDESGCWLEIVKFEKKEPNVSNISDVATQRPCNPKVETIDITEEVIDLDDDENPIQNERQISPPAISSIPATEPKKTKNGTYCIDISDNENDDEIVFFSANDDVTTSHVNNSNGTPVQSSTTTIVPETTESKPLDVTSTMNGLLKPMSVKSTSLSPPQIHPTNPTIPPNDEVENQLAEVLGQDSPVNVNTDIKPIMPPNVKQEFICDTQELENVLQNVFNNYSMTDEIISLDSEDEDFPSSQLNTTCVTDIPDFSSSFSMMYELKSEIPSDDEDVEFISSDPWFEPLSQTTADTKLEMSKSWRKIEAESKDVDSSSMDIEQPSAEVDESPSGSPDVSHDTIDNIESTLPESTATSISPTFAEPCSSSIFKERTKFFAQGPLLKKPTPTKVAIIEPLPNKRYKRRSGGDDEVHHKKKKERHDSLDSAHRYLSTIEQKLSERNKNKSAQSSSSASRKEMREKVKALYPEPPTETKKEPKENKVQPKVKVTTKNRGDFLTKLEPSSSTPSPIAKIDKSKTDAEPSSSKTSDCKSEPDDFTKHTRKPKTHRVANDNGKVPAIADVDLFKIPSYIPNENEEIPVNSSRTVFPKLPITSSAKTPGQSILRKNIEPKLMYENNIQSRQSKKVKFPDRIIAGCKEVDVYDHVCEFSSWKKNQNVIRESAIESNLALSVILNWNIRWLQEQQKHSEPPPLYRTVYQNGNVINDVIEKYREELKYSIFHSVWKQMFAVWNVPNNDNFPLTQDPNCRDYYTIEIAKVENSSKDPTNTVFTIFAKSQNLDMANCGGKMSILTFRITKPKSDILTKTTAFAYISSCARSTDIAGLPCSKMIIKIYAKAFYIVLGEAKIKVLNYAKQHLRQFQAFGTTRSCPIINAICDVNFQDNLNLISKQISKEKYKLDSEQKKAVVVSKNCFYKESSVNFIDGASGTGKTQSIVSLIQELLNCNVKDKVLIITVNDKLADDLIYRICKDGYDNNVLRFGNCQGINNNVKHCTFDNKVAQFLATEGKKLVNVEDEIKLARAKLHCNKLLSDKNEDISSRIRECEREIDDLGKENSKQVNHIQLQLAKQEVIKAANVVVTALATCWSSIFEHYFIPNNTNRGDVNSFKICIFDDANSYDENSMLIPQMLQIPHLVLVGDRKVKSYPNSPYHKMLHYFSQNNKDFVVYLNEDHRMHQDVSFWVREYFKLNGDVKIPLMKRRTKLKPFVVIDHVSDEITNYQSIVCEKLARCIVDVDPEKSQIGLSVLVARDIEKELIRGLFARSNLHKKVIVDHFDGFSTRENDIVVLCLPSMRIFDEWLYIAMTRAKISLIICGDFDKIEPVSAIKSLVEYAKSKNIFYSLKNPDLLSLNNLKDILVPQSEV